MATDTIREAMSPGTITTLGSLRPGDVGVFVRADGDGEPFVVLDVHPEHEATRIHKVTDHSPYWSDWHGKIVRYLGRGRIESARIVMEGEPDRIAELESQVRTLREALNFERVELSSRVGCSEQFAKFGPCCGHHECHAIYRIRKVLAATAPKEEGR